MPRWTAENFDELIQSQYKVADPKEFGEYKPTNADRIRAMSDEELAEFLVSVETHGYHDQSVAGTLEMVDWLKSEVEEKQ